MSPIPINSCKNYSNQSVNHIPSHWNAATLHDLPDCNEVLFWDATDTDSFPAPINQLNPTTGIFLDPPTNQISRNATRGLCFVPLTPINESNLTTGLFLDPPTNHISRKTARRLSTDLTGMPPMFPNRMSGSGKWGNIRTAWAYPSLPNSLTRPLHKDNLYQ